MDAIATFFGTCFQFVLNFLETLFWTKQNPIRAKLLFIIGEGAHLYTGGTDKTVTTGHIGGCDVSVGKL